MKVVVLCGGLGTRLREETEYRPKPMVEVGGQPILWHIMKTYAHYGLREFVLCLGYRGNVIREYFLNYEAMSNDFTISLGGGGHKIDYHCAHDEQDFRVTLVNTGAETMTGGRVKRIEPHIDGDLFLVTYGDGLSDINIRRLIDFHCSHGKIATVTAVRPVSRFGLLDIDEQGSVKSFAEKPQVEGWINAGFFVFNRRFFDYLTEGDACVMEQQPLARLAEDGQLAAYRHEGFFFAMDTYREYEALNRIWDSGSAVEGLALMMADFEAFRNRSVFVTGHTGFKGSWLSLWLARLGARVTGYALPPPTEPSIFAAASVRDLLAMHHEADLRDASRLEAAIHSAAPEVVFHLAAQPLVRESYVRPRETFEVNVMGTVNLLEAVRKLHRPCVVIVVTSDKCYENHEQVSWYRETDPLGGHDPYSASKGAAEIVAASYRRSFFPAEMAADTRVKLATARAGNVIGGGDWAKDRIITDAVRHLVAGEPVPVRNPRSVRPWQHVLEPLGGYMTLAARMLQSDDPCWCDAWNFGPTPGDELPVHRLVELFVDAWGSGSWIEAPSPNQPAPNQPGPSHPHEAAELRLNIDKALRQLEWRPWWNVAEAVRRTAGWYRQFYRDRPSNMRAACDDDIDAYETTDSVSQ